MACLLSVIFTFVATAQQQQTIDLVNRAGYSYTIPSGGSVTGPSNTLGANYSTLVDPAGRILDCAGQPFSNYDGFRVGLYDPLGNFGEIAAIVSLTPTVPPPGVPRGFPPNFQNVNPFVMTSLSDGTYNFLLNPALGQLAQGKTYILLITPPTDSGLQERRIRIVVGNSNPNGTYAFSATALDGQPISIQGAAIFEQGTISTTVGSNFLTFGIGVNLCEERALQIIKTGDRAAAEPGDIPVYRIEVKNLTSSTITNLVVTDTLPVGFQIAENSVRASIGGVAVPVTLTRDGRNLTFTVTGSLPPRNQDKRLNIVYAAIVTPDAVRGSGQNSASVRGIRADNGRGVGDGPAIYTMRIRPGIVSDCGTIIGRVFVDKNFDGEQQPGEPGVPNAVVFMDDGNRIVTDPNGLYSVMNVISGSRSLVLDLTSLPGYTLAPNLYFIERNSQSRLVRLEPGGLVRANFAVTPIFQGDTQGGQKQ
ncbi:isopeptide-forming domain-containing fimbrial protein [Tumidithrix helvetica]|uniref:isopeptide-forming domain-containing fimbrial protein n=1 Tax=Tumidithrix helvetica TaxID=3457545 RepID=UPI003CC54283